jgi:hypothetical protein
MADSPQSLSIKDGTGAASKLASISGSFGFSTYHALTGTLASDVSSSLSSISSSVSGISSSLSSIITGTAINVDIITGDTSTITQSVDRTTAAVQASYTSSYNRLGDVSSSLSILTGSSSNILTAIQVAHTASLTKLENISSSVYYSNTGSARYLYDISSSLGSIGTNTNNTSVLNQISESLKNIDTDASNLTRSLDQATASLANISSSITFISQSFYPKISGAYDYATGSYNKLVDISSSMTYVSQSTLGFATGSVITAVSGGNFTSGVYTIQPDNARVSLQILSKVNNKLIYILIGTDTPTLSPPKYSYEMTPSGSYYAFESDVRLTHKILSGSTTFAADDYILITETKK